MYLNVLNAQSGYRYIYIHAKKLLHLQSYSFHEKTLSFEKLTSYDILLLCMIKSLNLMFCSIIQPVYLSILLKKGKGNNFEIQPQSSKKLRNKLSSSISVNGERVDTEHEEVNIHDYATFEKEEQLIPEFRISIKSRHGSTLSREKSVEDDGLTRKSSFKDVARQVVSMENVLKKWPRRPRSRHHSSSSEDIAEDEENRDVDITPDDISVHTDTSELSDSEDINRDLAPEEIDIHTASIAGSISLSDGPSANINGNRTGTDGDLDINTSLTTSLVPKEENIDSDTDKTKLHEKGVVKHEHGSGKVKNSNTTEGKAEKQRSGFRCPCVVL